MDSFIDDHLLDQAAEVEDIVVKDRIKGAASPEEMTAILAAHPNALIRIVRFWSEMIGTPEAHEKAEGFIETVRVVRDMNEMEE